MEILVLTKKINGHYMRDLIPIAIAKGDGIGPEIMEATLFILKESGSPLEIQEVEIGEKVYLRGELTGIDPSLWDVVRHSKAFLKAPITTPTGGGFKSVNVAIRTALGLYANVRPCIAYAPYVQTKHPGMNVVIIRENEEDLYMGIEYQPTRDTFEALKMMTYNGCERIIRYAFEYARTYHRKKVTCFTKDNILKFTDGLFHKVFDVIGMEYPEIEKEHWIIDIGSAKLADTPTVFDIIVTPNLYGDIISDIAAQIAGSVGLAGSANIGTAGAMFEAIHGSAPRRAGQNLANPSGLLLAAVQMLVHIGLVEKATLIQNAWLRTLEEGIHTYDIFNEKTSKEKVGTREFARAVANRLGKKPEILLPAHYAKNKASPVPKNSWSKSTKELIGVDIFIEWNSVEKELSSVLTALSHTSLQLQSIGNRGVEVWPTKLPETLCSDCWRCRYMRKEKSHSLHQDDVLSLLQLLTQHKMDIVQVHYLFIIDHQKKYSGATNED